ncbi:hypothetical protein O9G_006231 [Rozella allomycis CSF55]|uniref:Uncharacterized protein n=1 Tax=Rozella allomycis (strain CSF55) TaxID=988480 RepID=A0A075B5A8_ROZAC|nr:hypothetical protein O9G_006231 [Rozella allomycis CSF55]|eukprot:EPZ36915.1 hypothetical protein O9G_006231 [Rozella allomycis CSF55]
MTLVSPGISNDILEEIRLSSVKIKETYAKLNKRIGTKALQYYKKELKETKKTLNAQINSYNSMQPTCNHLSEEFILSHLDILIEDVKLKNNVDLWKHFEELEFRVNDLKRIMKYEVPIISFNLPRHQEMIAKKVNDIAILKQTANDLYHEMISTIELKGLSIYLYSKNWTSIKSIMRSKKIMSSVDHVDGYTEMC